MKIKILIVFGILVLLGKDF